MPIKYLTDAERFGRLHVKDPSGCWLWLAGRNNMGYGVFHTGSKREGNRRIVGAHRFAYANFRGEIPAKMLVLHKCDTPACVNPKHLWLGTQADNLRDMVSKKRHGWTVHPESLPRGTKAYWARLTEKDVRAIRALPLRFGMFKQLARQYGVSDTQIRNIYYRKKWTHI